MIASLLISNKAVSVFCFFYPPLTSIASVSASAFLKSFCNASTKAPWLSVIILCSWRSCAFLRNHRCISKHTHTHCMITKHNVRLPTCESTSCAHMCDMQQHDRPEGLGQRDSCVERLTHASNRCRNAVTNIADSDSRRFC